MTSKPSDKTGVEARYVQILGIIKNLNYMAAVYPD